MSVLWDTAVIWLYEFTKIQRLRFSSQYGVCRLLQSTLATSHRDERFDVFTGVIMNNAVFLGMMTPCDSYKNRRLSAWRRRQYDSPKRPSDNSHTASLHPKNSILYFTMTLDVPAAQLQMVLKRLITLLRRIPSSGMLRRVALVRTEVSE
jgi:hypothetical protein